MPKHPTLFAPQTVFGDSMMHQLGITTRGDGLTLSLLVANFLFSVYTMFGQLWRSGYADAVLRLWWDGPHILPGSQNPILSTYTGIRPLDNLVTCSVVLFANITDGSTPQFSLFAFQFTGQWASVLTMVFMEGLKVGSMTESLLWLLFMQTVTYGCGMPLYAIFHLLKPRVSDHRNKHSALPPDIEDVDALRSLPLSILIGYGIPTILAAYPFSNTFVHQWFGGAWQGHPIWIFLVNLFVQRRIKSYSTAEGARTEQDLPSQSAEPQSIRKLHDQLYCFAILTATVTHLSSLALLSSTRLFPSLLSPPVRQTLTFANTYQPAPFWKTKPMESMANAVLEFFQYDLYSGSAASIIWAAGLYLRSRGSVPAVLDCCVLVGRLIALFFAAGPSAVFVALLWEMDVETSKKQVVNEVKKA